MSQAELCGAVFACGAGAGFAPCCEQTCDKEPGHEGAHFADVHGTDGDGTERIAVLRWRTER